MHSPRSSSQLVAQCDAEEGGFYAGLMKCVMSSQQTPVKFSMGVISLASPTKPAINIPQVTSPAFNCEQGHLVRASGLHKYGSHVTLWAKHTLIFK